jgi:plasmid stabilization system protein ParE
MSFRYILHEKAQADYESSLIWYLERSQQAAENFVLEIDKGIQLICNNPTRWSNKYKHYYELSLKIFPFTIVYSIEEKQVIVISAIYHHKRNPKRKYRK